MTAQHSGCSARAIVFGALDVDLHEGRAAFHQLVAPSDLYRHGFDIMALRDVPLRQTGKAGEGAVERQGGIARPAGDGDVMKIDARLQLRLEVVDVTQQRLAHGSVGFDADDLSGKTDGLRDLGKVMARIDPNVDRQLTPLRNATQMSRISPSKSGHSPVFAFSTAGNVSRPSCIPGGWPRDLAMATRVL